MVNYWHLLIGQLSARKTQLEERHRRERNEMTATHKAQRQELEQRHNEEMVELKQEIEREKVHYRSRSSYQKRMYTVAFEDENVEPPTSHKTNLKSPTIQARPSRDLATARGTPTAKRPRTSSALSKLEPLSPNDSHSYLASSERIDTDSFIQDWSKRLLTGNTFFFKNLLKNNIKSKIMSSVHEDQDSSSELPDLTNDLIANRKQVEDDADDENDSICVNVSSPSPSSSSRVVRSSLAYSKNDSDDSANISCILVCDSDDEKPNDNDDDCYDDDDDDQSNNHDKPVTSTQINEPFTSDVEQEVTSRLSDANTHQLEQNVEPSTSTQINEALTSDVQQVVTSSTSNAKTHQLEQNDEPSIDGLETNQATNDNIISKPSEN